MACKRCGMATSVAEAHGDGPMCECNHSVPDGKMFSNYEVYNGTLVAIATFFFYRRILFIVTCDDDVTEEIVLHLPPPENHNILESLRQQDVIDVLKQRFSALAIYQDGKQVL